MIFSHVHFHWLSVLLAISRQLSAISFAAGLAESEADG
jgi:hypothetical protein